MLIYIKNLLGHLNISEVLIIKKITCTQIKNLTASLNENVTVGTGSPLMFKSNIYVLLSRPGF